MPWFELDIPIRGELCVAVEADSMEDARKKARDLWSENFDYGDLEDQVAPMVEEACDNGRVIVRKTKKEYWV